MREARSPTECAKERGRIGKSVVFGEGAENGTRGRVRSPSPA